MEKEGLQRSIQYLQDRELCIEAIVTDRHPQINKWLRETHPNIRHYYDVWHVAKGKLKDNYVFCFARYGYKFMSTIGLRKKIEVLAKQRDCDDIGKWEKSIINHLYWCVASTPTSEEEVIKAKWLSLDSHMHNVHHGHGAKFPNCLHERLQGDRNKKWLKRRKY